MLKWPCLVLTIHTLLVVGVAISVLIAIRSHPGEECALLWYVLLAVDFPASLLFSSFQGFATALTNGSRIAQEVVVPGIFHTVAGGIQYSSLTVIAQYLRTRRKSCIGSAHCTNCGYDLRGNVSGRCPECGTPVDNAP